MTEKNKIKVENFKIGRDASSQINSGLVILIIGTIFLLYPLFGFSNVYDVTSTTSHLTIVGQIQDLFFVIILTVSVYGFDFITTGALGWGLGGLIAALLYGNEGKNGPIYASYLLLRVISGLVLISIAFILASPAISDRLLLVPAIPVVLLVISLPMILVAMIGYRIGLWISPSE